MTYQKLSQVRKGDEGPDG